MSVPQAALVTLALGAALACAEPASPIVLSAGGDAGEESGDDTVADGGTGNAGGEQGGGGGDETAPPWVDGGSGGTDAQTDPNSAPPYEPPDEQTAVIEAAKPALTAPLRLDALGGSTPSLFVVSGQPWVFYNDVSENDTIGHAWLRTARWDSVQLSVPVRVADGGLWVDLLVEPDHLLATVAAGRGVRMMRGSLDGMTWEQLAVLESASPDRICNGGYPSFFFRGADAPHVVAVGYESYNGVFGCVPKTVMAWGSAGAWEQSPSLLGGTPSAAFLVGEQRVLVSTHGLWRGTANEGLLEVPGGDTTAEQLRGTDAVRTANGDLLIVQHYNYASADTLALLRSTDGGSTWPHRTILQTGADAIYGASIAADAGALYVAWAASPGRVVLGSYHRRVVFLMASMDGGSTWSEPAIVSDTTQDENISAVTVVGEGTRAVVAYARTGEDLNNDPTGVFLVTATF